MPSRRGRLATTSIRPTASMTLLIGRQEDPDIGALLAQGAWQGRRNIRQTACLGEVGELARHEKHAHEMLDWLSVETRKSEKREGPCDFQCRRTF